MTEIEALAILNINSSEEESVTDAFELACFKEKSTFYMDPILPAIIDSRIKKISQFQEAFNFLNQKSDNSNSVNEIELLDLLVNEWETFFNHYEKNKAILRKELANALSGYRIIQVLNFLKENELNYGKTLLKNVNLEVAAETKLSVQVPIIEIIAELKAYLEQGVIDNSLRSLNKLNDIKDNFKFKTEIIRLKKLMNE